MPPRHAYWTILIDGTPTAFRARERDELLPTLHQLQRKNANAEMRWFARGKLWPSREAEHEDFQRRKRHADAPFAKAPAGGERRNADWRPGGTHKDPRDRFKKKNRPERAWSEGEGEDRRSRPSPPRDRPWQGRKPGGPPRDRPWSGKPRVEGQGPRVESQKPKSASRKPEGGNRKPQWDRPDGDRKWETKSRDRSRDQRPWSNKPPAGGPRSDRPWTPGREARGDKPWQDKKPGGAPRGNRPRGDKPWQNRQPGPPRDDRPWSPKPPAAPQREKRTWSAKPPPQSKEGGDRSFSPKRRGPRKRHDDEPPDE